MTNKHNTTWLQAVMLLVIYLLPFAPPVLLIWIGRVPTELGSRTLSLSGEWQVEADGFKGVAQLPTLFAKAKLPEGPLTFRRRVRLEPLTRGQAQFLVLSGVQSAALTASVDGRALGRVGVPEKQFLLEHNAVRGFFVAPELLNGEEVELSLTATPAGLAYLPNAAGFLGAIELFPAAEGAWFVEQNQTLLNAFQLGSISTLAAGLLLLGYLFSLQRTRSGQLLIGSTFAIAAGAMLYLASKSGFPFGLLEPRWVHFPLGVVALSVTGVGWVLFLELYETGAKHISKWGRAAFVYFPLVGIATLGFRDELSYTLLAAGLFVVAILSLIATTRRALRVRRWSAALIAGAVSSLSAAGISDLLSDMHVIVFPRLFSTAVGEVALVVVGLAVVEFLGLAVENTQLAGQLQIRNDALALALHQAEESGRAKAEFLANTSHELRTPLNVLINVPEGIVEEIDSVGMEPAEISKHLKKVVKTGRHLLTIVSDILDFSELDSHRIVLSRESVRVSDLLKELEASVGPIANTAGVGLAIHLDQPDASVEIDRRRMIQVLTNLVKNAIKYSEGHGTVRVEAGPHPAASEKRFCFRVIDQGIGIASEDHRRVFEGFRQGGGDGLHHTRRFGGTGLGLAISKQIVTLHGGTIHVDSAVGQGSTFEVEIPHSLMIHRNRSDVVSS